MTVKAPCINCGRAGFLRVEYVIKGGSTRIDFYCGACEHSWAVRDDEDTRSPPTAKPRGSDDKPERSRS
jgi:hypothetical protein